MTTNATLLTPTIMDFLKQEQFSLIFSIDGPKDIHDKLRTYPSGKGSHSIVLNNIKEYHYNYSTNFTARGTFTKLTNNFSEQVLFLNEQGFKSISVEPAQLEDSDVNSISSYSDICEVKKEYEKLAELYVNRTKKSMPINFFHFDYYLEKLLNPRSLYTQ